MSGEWIAVERPPRGRAFAVSVGEARSRLYKHDGTSLLRTSW
jgi:hypothetical protein